MFSRDTININDDDTGTVYTCPHCNGSVKFYIRDFNKHWESKHSNLEAEDFKGAPKDNGFLDFYCPECQTPTTVIFNLYAGGRHGEYCYKIEKIENGYAL